MGEAHKSELGLSQTFGCAGTCRNHRLRPFRSGGRAMGNGERRARRRRRRRQNDRGRERGATPGEASSRQHVGTQRSFHQARWLVAFGQDFHHPRPIVFTTYELAHDMTPDVSSCQAAAAYFAIKLRNPNDAERVAAILRRHELPNNEILTTSAFVKRTILYWTVQTGMGAAFG